ncbi:hypothetical protein BDN71DRAFT_1101433 [Pleurotus eryngii]|uniref:Mediator of RNA polymerase II transcription subunit 25 von Willebrand factor type A domain-containing protein n=1 Tax=Pleurotus eryngii TaxID=5323 RepID=A0A9P6D6V2_PLEER|nr:hypothetical protein BDN71DRAFT_1101433 [Pleurotus eryngii]
MNQPPPQHQSPQQHPQNAQQPHIPPHIVVLADSSLALAAEWDQLVAEYLFPMLRALTQAPGGGTAKEPVKIRIAVVTYAASSVRPSPLVTKQFFTEPQILRDLQLEPYKLGIGQHPAAAHGLAALEGFVAAIELLDLIRECIPLKDYFPLHIFHLAAAHKDDAQAPRWNDATTLDGVAWDHLPTELRKRNIHLSTICVGKLAEFAELYKQATPESDATHPWFPTRPAHQVLISGLSAHPTHPVQLTHPTHPTQPAHPNQQPNQPNQPAQTIQSAYPAQATQLPQQNHPPAHLPTQPPLPNQPTQPQTPAVPATGAPQAAGAPAPTGTSTPTHAKRTHELAQTERPQADVKRAKPSPEKSSPMVAPAVPPRPASAPSNAPTNALPSTTGQPSAPPAPGPSATTAPPTTTTIPAPGPSSAPPPAPTGPTKHSAALPALPAGLSPQQFGRYRHLLEAKLHSIKAKLDALGRGEAEAGEGEVEGLKKQFDSKRRERPLPGRQHPL